MDDLCCKVAEDFFDLSDIAETMRMSSRLVLRLAWVMGREAIAILGAVQAFLVLSTLAQLSHWTIKSHRQVKPEMATNHNGDKETG